ncbi:class I SAM-dependent methyltransferase [Hyunsoonleella aestuarii]|nr:class I SAM-dependent methyltransferase [Hyunsoonleella aestuarii]
MHVIITKYPNWKDLQIHESSPGNRGHSVTLKAQAKNYIASQYFPNEPFGSSVKGFRNEDLENQTFKSNSFDLVVTSDVMEHIYEPEKAFREIHRTLKPGGAHIFSVPIINKHKPTQRWAAKNPDGSPHFLFEPEWHGNPADAKGSPVTFHWGYDIKNFIEKHTGAVCEIIYLDDLSKGIRAEYIEIVIAKKI